MNRLPLYLHAGLEPMFLMRNLTDRNQKFAGIPAANPVTQPLVSTRTERVLSGRGLQISASNRLRMFFRVAGRWLLKNQYRF